ncbi:MAG: hypothetical protein A3F13_05280 [Gammaproteobacteria bacterium RIFCSPHIGHO2_12_FULL_40_19]|nr:MAG: hypothetical protein A3F13_05280 [Gammaproteobacteria bacterium RIFCSPHIGHO2_12_FULL_40_19]
MFFKKGFWFYTFIFLLMASSALAGPWLLPGNLSVKSDIDLLADAGLIKAPVMTWPIAWVNIGPELLSPETKAKLPTEPESVQLAYQRIVTLYQKSYQPYKSQQGAYIAGSNRLNPFPTFQYQPYAKFANGISTAYQMKHFAESANISYYSAPNQSYSNYVHIDNSYADLLLGNWAIGFDQFNRWWGPGYSDAMILSQNAEPFPALGIQRMHAEAFKTKWLHWIGPWSVSSVVSENGSSYYRYPVSVDNDLFWFTNISIRPFQSLQLDVSRNVLFAGTQRSMTWPMFDNLVTGQDAYVNGLSVRDAPGSEEWDIGGKLNLESLLHIPVSLYQQTTFMADYPIQVSSSHYLRLPDYTTFLLGGSTSTQIKSDTLRIYAEYEYNITRYWWWMWKIACPDPYGNGQYPYTYYNKLLGSPIGSEGIGYTLGAILNENEGASDNVMIRFLQPNSLGWGTVVTPTYPFAKQDIIWLSLGRTFVLHHLGLLTPELGYLITFNRTTGALPTGFSATITWSKKFK